MSCAVLAVCLSNHRTSDPSAKLLLTHGISRPDDVSPETFSLSPFASRVIITADVSGHLTVKSPREYSTHPQHAVRY